MTAAIARQIVLTARPQGRPKLSDFCLEETVIPAPGAGQVLLRVQYLSLDPYMRGRMDDRKSYATPVPLGGVMPGESVAIVIASNHPAYSEGDIVVARTGWRTHAVLDGADLRKLDPAVAPVTTALGVLGMPGHSAYVGLLDIGQPKAGETVVVSAASGAVGSVVGQIAKIKGCRVLGIAGGEAKCRYVTNELGFDACVDHRAPDFAAALARACPNGIDVDFENVGGPVLQAIWPLLNNFARVVVCGLIAHSNDSAPPRGPDIRYVLAKRLTMRGFLILDHRARFGDFLRDVSAWLREGRIKYREDIVDGLENAAEAFIGMLEGRNFGKLIVRVGA
jgi:NADPH-dependent curcumin reductase CurA